MEMLVDSTAKCTRGLSGFHFCLRELATQKPPCVVVSGEGCSKKSVGGFWSKRHRCATRS